MALNKKTTIIAALGALILPVAAKHHAVEVPAETESCCDALTGFYGIGFSTGSFSDPAGNQEDADGYTLGLSLDISEDADIFLLYQDYDGGNFNEVTAVARKSYDLIDGFYHSRWSWLRHSVTQWRCDFKCHCRSSSSWNRNSWNRTQSNL